MKRNEQRLGDLWHIMTQANMGIMKIPGEETVKGSERISEEK